MESLDWLQWPAMLATLGAAWLIGSVSRRRRVLGFWCFLLSNLLWGLWGWYDQAYALILLQLCLAVLNIRGLKKNHPEQRGAA